MIKDDIIERLKDGDRGAFREVVDAFTGPMLATATRIIACSEDAEDIVQESFIKVWEKRRTIKSAESFVPWLKKIVVNRCYDLLRQKKRRGFVRSGDEMPETSIGWAGNDADSKIIEDDMTRILEYIVSGLSPRQRLVLPPGKRVRRVYTYRGP